MAAEFGEKMKGEFMLKAGFIQINHGSCGVQPKAVFNARIKKLDEVSRESMSIYRWRHTALWKQALESVAGVVGAKPENLTFVENVTHGFSDVIRSIELSPGDAICINSWSHRIMRSACQLVAEPNGAEIVQMKLEYPIHSEDEVVEQFENFLDTHKNTKIAIIDAIFSPTAVLLPYKRLAHACRERNVISIIDGAHAPGQIPLNLEEAGVDFFIGNLYKWMYAPLGSSILWVNPKYHDVIKPGAMSHHVYEKDFNMRYVNLGSRDETPKYTTPDVVDFLNKIGGQATVSAYTGKLLDKVTDKLVRSWKTQTLPIPKSMQAPNMRLVQLPTLKRFPATHSVPDQSFGPMLDLMRELDDRYHIMTAIFSIQDTPWIRLSANIYNTLEDYDKLDLAIQQLLKEDNY